MDLKGFWLGLKAAIIASSCCSFPLALVMAFSALGVGSATAALKIPKYKAYFLALGTMFLLISLYLRVKRSCGTCTVGDVKKEWQLVLVSVFTYILLTILLIYLLLPSVSEWIFS